MKSVFKWWKTSDYIISLCYLPIYLHPKKTLFTFYMASHVITCLRELGKWRQASSRIKDFETLNKKSRNKGQIASRGSSFRDAGQRPPNTGHPVKYGTPGPGKPIQKWHTMGILSIQIKNQIHSIRLNHESNQIYYKFKIKNNIRSVIYWSQ